MSAKTRTDKQKTLVNVSSLQNQSYALIESGKRDPVQVEALLTALQLFKENRLLVAIPKTADEMLPDPDYLQQLLSIHLKDSRMNSVTRNLIIRNFGVEYVGELYLVRWSYSKAFLKSVGEFLVSLGLPKSLDLSTVEWTPPYVNRKFLWMMNQPTPYILKEGRLNGFISRAQYAGEIFSHRNRRIEGMYFNLRRLKELLNPDCKLRAGMYVPNWEAPADPPK